MPRALLSNKVIFGLLVVGLLLLLLLLGCCRCEWQAQALWAVVGSAGGCGHTVYVLEEICCKKNK